MKIEVGKRYWITEFLGSDYTATVLSEPKKTLFGKKYYCTWTRKDWGEISTVHGYIKEGKFAAEVIRF